jgi:hypothetical protein
MQVFHCYITTLGAEQTGRRAQRWTAERSEPTGARVRSSCVGEWNEGRSQGHPARATLHNRESPGRAQDGKLREHEYQPCTKPRYSPVLKPAAGAPVRSTLKKRVT